MADRRYTAYVQKVVRNGKHGPYAVVREDTLGLVTFSLDQSVWREKRWPEAGSCIVLEDVHKKRSGWRANNCRFYRPEDQQSAQSTEKTNG